MSNALKNAIRWASKQRPGNHTKRINTRMLVSKFAEDATLANYGLFVWGMIKNTDHTSHTDPRGHITLCIKTQEMIKNNTRRVAHIYSKNDQGEEYDGFILFEERPDKASDGTPGDSVE